jgi:hypothetical protein
MQPKFNIISDAEFAFLWFDAYILALTLSIIVKEPIIIVLFHLCNMCVLLTFFPFSKAYCKTGNDPDSLIHAILHCVSWMLDRDKNTCSG